MAYNPDELYQLSELVMLYSSSMVVL